MYNNEARREGYITELRIRGEYIASLDPEHRKLYDWADMLFLNAGSETLFKLNDEVISKFKAVAEKVGLDSEDLNYQGFIVAIRASEEIIRGIITDMGRNFVDKAFVPNLKEQPTGGLKISYDKSLSDKEINDGKNKVETRAKELINEYIESIAKPLSEALSKEGITQKQLTSLFEEVDFDEKIRELIIKYNERV